MFVIIKKEKYMEKPDSSLLFRQPMYADKKQWKQFLSIFLLAAGVGFTVAGIIFFFAYNWEDLPKFAKLGIVQTLLVASVLLTVFTRWEYTYQTDNPHRSHIPYGYTLCRIRTNLSDRR